MVTTAAILAMISATVSRTKCVTQQLSEQWAVPRYTHPTDLPVSLGHMYCTAAATQHLHNRCHVLIFFL